MVTVSMPLNTDMLVVKNLSESFDQSRADIPPGFVGFLTGRIRRTTDQGRINQQVFAFSLLEKAWDDDGFTDFLADFLQGQAGSSR